MRGVSRIAAWAAVLLATSASAEVLPIAAAAKLFGTRPNAAHADLSPDGSKLVYIASGPTTESVAVVMDIASGNKKMLLKTTGKPEQLQACTFITSLQMVCSFGGIVRYDGQLVHMSRTLLVNTSTGEQKSLSVRDNSGWNRINQFDGRIIDRLAAEDGAFLMQRSYPGEQRTVGVDRIEVDPLKFRSVESPGDDADFFLSDGHGDVRFSGRHSTYSNGTLTGKTTYRYRAAGRRDWTSLAGLSEDFSPLTIERASNSLYYLDKLDGRLALYRMALDGTGKTALVAKNEHVDIDDVVRLYPGGEVVGYRFTDDRPRTVYTDPVAAKLGASLQRALPQAPLVDVAGASKDRQKLLVFASGDTDPGAYYLLDRTTKEMKSLVDARAGLMRVPLAKMRPVTIPTRDGKTIPAFVTAAADRPASGQPVVVMPHGGPSARDEWGFDWLAQFLAARGYTVIQPNYRGSSGYGDAFLGDNAFKGWKLAMDDIGATTDWAVKSGLADPKRVAIMGWSYGGYAALQSAAMDPRYKAVVAIAPVTDLAALRRDSDGFTDAQLAREMIGKGPHLKEGSPLARAASIQAPVLLVHGTVDTNVFFAHSRRMDAALRSAGKPVEFLPYKDLDHYLEDSQARTEMLTRIGQLLDRTIGH